MVLPITVIIPTMNRPESLDRTLKYMVEETDVPQQIIVVDQSMDHEIRKQNELVLNSYSSIELKDYIYQQIPSITKARNNGFSKASNEIIIFADDDIDVNVDTLRNVYSIMQDSNIALIAGIDEFTQSSSTSVGYILGTKSYRKRNIGHVTRSMLGRYPDNVNKRVETQWAQGYFFVVRKSLMDKWHCRWDENLTSYAYAEDLDFSFGYYKHANAEGLKCIIDPTVKVKHLATKEYRIPSTKSLYMYIINRTYLCHKHKMGILGAIACFWCNFWRIVQSLVQHQNTKILMHAMWCSFRYRKDICKGNIDYDKYMK